jgi:hypothetical protein
MLVQKRPRQILMGHGGLGASAAICGHQLRRRRGRGHDWSAGLRSCNSGSASCLARSPMGACVGSRMRDCGEISPLSNHARTLILDNRHP